MKGYILEGRTIEAIQVTLKEITWSDILIGSGEIIPFYSIFKKKVSKKYSFWSILYEITEYEGNPLLGFNVYRPAIRSLLCVEGNLNVNIGRIPGGA